MNGVQKHLCRSAFNQQGKLNRHLNRHSIIKPFPCFLCGCQFSELSDFNRHCDRKSHKSKCLIYISLIGATKEESPLDLTTTKYNDNLLHPKQLTIGYDRDSHIEAAEEENPLDLSTKIYNDNPHHPELFSIDYNIGSHNNTSLSTRSSVNEVVRNVKKHHVNIKKTLFIFCQFSMITSSHFTL